MFLLNTTMLREKFTVTEAGAGAPMVATGNRITLPLMSKSGNREERLVVRGQNMHTTLRMAAMICRSFYNDGPILTRSPAFPWLPNWVEALPDHEIDNNANSWIAVYSGGRPIFKHGEYHPFLDIIEQCDARNRDEYDRAVAIAENAFNMAGRGVSIDHQTNIAMVIGAMFEKTRVGLVFRNPRRSTTFNFGIEPKGNGAANAEPYLCLLHAAAWLELVQLSVIAGFYKVGRGTAQEGAPPLDAVQRRLSRLNAELLQFEESYAVKYRPERPDMLALIDETAAFSRGE